MGVHFLLVVHLLIILEILAQGCLPGEYKNNNNVCCPMCDKGHFVKAHCTLELSSSTCVLCAPSTYMNHPNGLTECFRCKECDLGADLVAKLHCTTTSDTVCECRAGHFCLNQDCDLCQEHTRCQPGQYVKKPGTPRLDTVCEKCPQSQFSQKNNSIDCSPWTNCLESGRILRKEGTSTTDSECKDKRRHESIGGAVAVLFIFALLVYVFSKRKKNEKGVDTAIFDFHLPIQERGTAGVGREHRYEEGT